MTIKLIAYVAVEVKDKNGHLLHYEQKEANSLVRGFIDLLYVKMSKTSLATGLNTANGAFSINNGSDLLATECPSGLDSYGIVIGSGTGAVAITNYNVGTQILTGSTSGKLNYLATLYTIPVTAGTTRSFTISRGFTNASGAAVSVNEVGLVSYATASGNVLIDRTLMSFSVANGTTATVTYTIQVTV